MLQAACASARLSRRRPTPQPRVCGRGASGNRRPFCNFWQVEPAALWRKSAWPDSLVCDPDHIGRSIQSPVQQRMAHERRLPESDIPISHVTSVTGRLLEFSYRWMIRCPDASPPLDAAPGLVWDGPTSRSPSLGEGYQDQKWRRTAEISSSAVRPFRFDTVGPLELSVRKNDRPLRSAPREQPTRLEVAECA